MQKKIPMRQCLGCREMNGECLKKAMKSKALERAFSVQIPEEIYEELRQQMEAKP